MGTNTSSPVMTEEFKEELKDGIAEKRCKIEWCKIVREKNYHPYIKNVLKTDLYFEPETYQTFRLMNLEPEITNASVNNTDKENKHLLSGVVIENLRPRYHGTYYTYTDSFNGTYNMRDMDASSNIVLVSKEKLNKAQILWNGTIIFEAEEEIKNNLYFYNFPIKFPLFYPTPCTHFSIETEPSNIVVNISYINLMLDLNIRKKYKDMSYFVYQHKNLFYLRDSFYPKHGYVLDIKNKKYKKLSEPDNWVDF